MKIAHSLSVLFGAQAVFSASVHSRAQNGTAIGATNILPDVYIVEFANDGETSKTFYESLAVNGVETEHRMELSFRFFKGVSFQLKRSTSNSTYLKLRESSKIQNIWPVTVTQLDNRGTPQTLETVSGTAQTHVKRQAGTNQTFAPHVLTQIDRLHAEGITGKGLRVAVIDSGVDYTHPSLGGCFGPGCLVETGYDFVGNNYRAGVVPPQPDDDPMDDCAFGHGTHVAGTVAAQLDAVYGFTGAAPGAKLAAYRIWNCISGTTDDIQLAAFARAVEDGADIISYSNGFSSDWSSHLLAVVASRISESGVPFVISEGNDGGLGMFMASTPATGHAATGVGAVSNSVVPVILQRASYTTNSNTSASNSSINFGFLMGEPAFLNTTTLPLWSATEFNNACQPLPDNTPDLSDKIVLLEFPLNPKVSRCYTSDQGTNVAAKGGRYMFYFDRTNLTMRDMNFVYADGIVGVARVTPYQATEWISLLKDEKKITVSITGDAGTYLEQLENHETGGYLANQLTSWGPSWELNITPQLVSPGENILSTYPVAEGSYRIMTGTSMAAPLVAGAYALLGQVYGKLAPGRMRRILTTTSKPIQWHDGTKAYDILAPVMQQGSGLIQVYDAAHTLAELSVDSLAFNDTDHFVGSRTFSIQNNGPDAVFELTHRKAVTMNALTEFATGLRVDSFPNTIVEDWAEISFDSQTVTVPAKSSVNVTVTCTPPQNVNATLLPIYSGFITATNVASNKTLVLPYLGVAGNMRSTVILSADHVYLASNYSPAPSNANYTIAKPDPANPPDTENGNQSSTPNVYIDAVVGTQILRVEVLQGKTVLGALAGWPRENLPRGDIRAWFNGLLADGTALEEGKYSMRVSALRIFGSASSEEDWDIVQTTEFGITYRA